MMAVTRVMFIMLALGSRAIGLSSSRTRHSIMTMSQPGPNVKRLVLVRHGEVDLEMFNGKKCFYGGVDIPLSAKGEAEASAAAAFLSKEEDISVIWTSPLSRAVYGAERIAERQGIDLADVVRHDGFREVARGDWVGLNEAEVGHDCLARWNRDPAYRPPGGGEALADVAARVLAAKDELLARSPWGSTTTLVSHMWVTRSILGQAMGYDCTLGDTAKLQEIDLPTASVSVVEYTRQVDGGGRGGGNSLDRNGEGEGVGSASSSDSAVTASVLYSGRKPPVDAASTGDAWGG